MGIMGLMNSKDALGKDQHNSRARLRMAEKDTLLKADLGNDSRPRQPRVPTISQDVSLTVFKCPAPRLLFLDDLQLCEIAS